MFFVCAPILYGGVVVESAHGESLNRVGMGGGLVERKRIIIITKPPRTQPR